jgi:hypothetical protein
VHATISDGAALAPVVDTEGLPSVVTKKGRLHELPLMILLKILQMLVQDKI